MKKFQIGTTKKLVLKNSNRDFPKLLIPIPRMPFPLNSGGRIAIYDTLKILCKKYELTIIIIDDNNKNIEFIDEIKKFSNSVFFFSKSKLGCYVNAFIGLVFGNPLQVGYFYSKDVQNLIDKLSLSHDLFLSFMIRTSSYGINLNIKKINYAIDSMYLNYLNSTKNTKSIFWKLIYSVEIPLLFKYEKKHVKKFNLTTYVNKEESKFWKVFGNTFNLPHGVKEDILNYDLFDKNYSNSISFIGRMDYQPNIEAVLWFCDNVLPYLKEEIKFLIIGGFAKPEILELSKKHKNVDILGFVEDPFLILRSCFCTVAPMRSGGGLQTKILMSMAVESITILNSQSSKAIKGIKNGVNAIIENNPIKMAKKINLIFDNPKNFSEIRLAARNLIRKNYSLTVIEDKIFKLINKTLS